MNEIDPEILSKIRFLAFRMAKTPQGKHFHIDDIEQEARIGFLLACQRYDSAKGVQLWTYCEPRVCGQILDYFRANTPGKRWRKNLKTDNSLKPVVVSYEELTDENNSEDINDLIINSHDRKTLFSKLLVDEFEFDDFFLVQCAVYKLSECNIDVLIRYFWLDYSMREIAQQLNLTESRISQIITKALRKVKTYLENPQMLYNIDKGAVEELFAIVKREQKRRWRMNTGKKKQEVIKETLEAINESASMSEAAKKLGIKEKVLVTRMRNYIECGDAGKKKGWYKPRMSKKKKLALEQEKNFDRSQELTLDDAKKREFNDFVKEELIIEELQQDIQKYGKQVSQANKNVLFGIDGVFTFFGVPYKVKIFIEKGSM